MEIVLTSIIAFASTNLDDIFILTLFFGDKRYKASDICLGQYLGICTLIAASLIGSLIGHFIESKYVGLLGLFPLYLGLKGLLSLIKRENNDEELAEEKKDTKTGILHVATVTIANGGDNIGTYIPLFATLSVADKSIMIILFLVMVSIWLLTAWYLTTHPLLAKMISTYGHIMTPLVLILLGIFILKENGSFVLVPWKP
jgi:cadmium resistance transport/sequestration family protein